MLKIKYDADGTTFLGFQEMSESELAYTYYQIQKTIAGVANIGGNTTLHLGSYGGSFDVTVGSFSDYYVTSNAGAHPTAGNTALTAVTANIKQIVADYTPTYFPRPLYFDNQAGSSSDSFKELSDTMVNQIYDAVVDNLASATLGSYVISLTAPATGTWTAVTSFRNYVNANTYETYYLWRCTAYPAPENVTRPVRWTNATDTTLEANSYVEMSDTDLETLALRFFKYVFNNYGGRYKFQETTPTPGTWVQVSTVSDSVSNVGSVSYTGVYSTTYIILYAGSRNKGYAGTRSYAGSRNKSYSRSYSGYTRANYTGTFSTTYTTALTTYTGTYSTTYGIGYGGSRTRTYSSDTVLATTRNITNYKLWLKTG